MTTLFILLLMMMLLMIPEQFKSSKCGNHENYVIDNDDVVDVDVIDDT